MELKISIEKKLLQDFLGFLFPKDVSGYYKVTRKVNVGRLLCSLVEYSYKPVEQRGDLTLVLPACRSLKSADNRFVYLSAESEAKFVDFLDATFDIDFDRYWIAGLKLGLPQKDIIYAYITSRKLVSLNDDIETLKKRMYRGSTRQMQSVYRQLLNKAQYADRLVHDQLKSSIF